MSRKNFDPLQTIPTSIFSRGIPGRRLQRKTRILLSPGKQVLPGKTLARNRHSLGKVFGRSYQKIPFLASYPSQSESMHLFALQSARSRSVVDARSKYCRGPMSTWRVEQRKYWNGTRLSLRNGTNWSLSVQKAAWTWPIHH